MLKLLTLGALGYAAYRYFERKADGGELRLAGGPLSKQAAVQSSPDLA